MPRSWHIDVPFTDRLRAHAVCSKPVSLRPLREHGMSQEEAGALIEATGMEVYQPVPDALFRLSRLCSAVRESRVRWLFAMITRHFFSSPVCSTWTCQPIAMMSPT